MIRKHKDIIERAKISTLAALLFVMILIAIAMGYIAAGLIEGYEEDDAQQEEAASEGRWDSDKKLVDDRLGEDSPIMYAIAPTMLDGTQVATGLLIYNDGTYTSGIFAYDSYDEFQEELASPLPFYEQVKEAYGTFKDDGDDDLITSDLEPSDMRDAYLMQYEVSDFSMSSVIDTTADNSVFYIFGVTYGDDLAPSVHMYYYQTQTVTGTVASDEALDCFSKLAELAASDWMEDS